MRLFQLLKPIGSFSSSRAIVDFNVKGISCNSKSVRPGFVFVAVKGASIDGSAFIGDAVRRGARAVISGSGGAGVPGRGVNLIKVRDTRRTLAALASEFYRHPSLKMKVVGVTGTNGKTTITYLIEAIIEAYGRRAAGGARPGVIGTVNNRFGGTVIASINTTPGPLELHGLLQRMLGAGVTHAVMEVSSHALDQGRTSGINFSSAIFTNLTQDHLDYHAGFEEYFRAKAKLFSRLPKSAFAIVNCDDRYGRKLKNMTRARVYTYGMGGRADIRAEGLTMDVDGSRFTLVAPGTRIAVRTRLIGEHNIYNILAAAGWALAEGIPPAVVARAVGAFSLVPGRLQKIECRRGFSVFVDYAHTEDALRNVISSLRRICRGKIIVVFGCGGDRDRTKRPLMGGIVEKLADYAVITSDNPRSEEPGKIIAEILAGVRKCSHCVIPDRAEAIRAALGRARKGDIVLVAGKGHENYQVLRDETIHFDDSEAVRKCLRLMRY